jgi:hypothetical protein
LETGGQKYQASNIQPLFQLPSSSLQLPELTEEIKVGFVSLETEQNISFHFLPTNAPNNPINQ